MNEGRLERRATGMSTTTQISVTWAQALACRMSDTLGQDVQLRLIRE
jgi:hypothetical protein